MRRRTAKWLRAINDPERHPWATYLVPLLAFILVVALDWVRLDREGVASPQEARELLYRVGVAAYVAALFVLLFTRSWSLQQLGLLGLLIAGAELKVRLIARAGPQPVREWERDITQATFEVSMIAILVALFMYAAVRIVRWMTEQHYHDEEDPYG
jgi:hypothetical protein